MGTKSDPKEWSRSHKNLEATHKRTPVLLGKDTSSTATVEGNLTRQTQALKDFYRTLGGQSWASKSGWLSGLSACDNWFGVTCSNTVSGEEQVVTGLALGFNSVTGQLADLDPVFFRDLMGSLQSLYLDGNRLYGTTCRVVFAGCPKREYEDE